MERHREGAWAFFRLTDRARRPRILRPLLEGLDRSDPALAGRPDAAGGGARAALAGGAGLLRPPGSGLGPDPLAPCARGGGRGGGVGRAWAGQPIRDLARSRHRHRPHAAAAGAERAVAAVGLDASHAMLVGRPRQSREGGLVARRAAPGRHLCAAVPAQHLRPRHHPPGAALPGRSRRGRSARRRASWLRAGGCSWSISPRTAWNSCARRRRIAASASRADQVAGWLEEAGLDCTLSREIAPPGDGRGAAHGLPLARRRTAASSPTGRFEQNPIREVA